MDNKLCINKAFDEKIIAYAFYLAKRSFETNQNIARHELYELALFLAKTRDISTALKKISKKPCTSYSLSDLNNLIKSLKLVDIDLYLIESILIARL